MLRGPLSAVLLFSIFACGGAKETPDTDLHARHLRQAMAKVISLHTLLGPPQPGDWLLEHHERGQTFEEYLGSRPVTARGKRRVIYVQPIGEFSRPQQRIVTATADFLQAYFDLPVVVQKPLPAETVPAAARRKHPSWGMEQLLTSFILDQVLAPRLPDDAAAMIALTATDLWPGEGWNFVFGQASLEKRVGVWSIYRNGDADQGQREYLLCLKRTLNTAAHETGHMFSIHHCTKYECNMCGSNNRDEADRQPLYLCPECMAKVCWATASDPLARYRKLASFCASHGLGEEQAFYESSAKRLEGP
jgi:archaemetzincin